MSSRPRHARTLALLAPVGAALFSLAWLVLGFLSPGYQLFDLVVEPYSQVSQPISGLGLGVTGPWMNGAFMVSGILVTAGIVGVALCWTTSERKRTRVVALALFAACGIGMVMCGLFDLEAVMLHMAGFALAVIFPLAGFVVAGYSLKPSQPRLASWLYVAGPLALALLVTFMVLFDPYAAGENVGIAGVVQRALVSVVLGTLAALGVTARRMTPSP